ncbi:MAG TPA: Mrp/NBP35 family ATP-binding protein [Verrucomicrobiae bacterium]|jgi:ATP-binding protein involved in chromosome partitioning|nr:Mrp/NBP35 family ATP-binding protein [Verrucomicrobiae bacterium]
MTQDSVLHALRGVKYPGYTRDIVSFGIVKNIAIEPGAVRVSLHLSAPNPPVAAQLKAEAERALLQLPGVERVLVEIASAAPAAAPAPAWNQRAKIPGLNRVVAIASGKGGVGKSTVSVNLACALRHLGASVGLLDCDIYGPSIPLMMGVHEKPTISETEKLMPLTNHGVKLMSMGFLLDGDAPVIWRGPMIMKTIQQFISDVEWGDLDYLLVDLPPGTGDAQLSLCQTVPLDGGVIVTTPQEASLGVVRKGIAMFEKVNVPILGLVENMSYYTAPGGQRIEIFGHGGGRNEAERRGVPFLGEIPIFVEIREGGDTGQPITVTAPESISGQAFIKIGESLRQKLG